MSRPHVILADDHQAVLDCVRAQLAGEFEIVASVMDGQAALDAALILKPDAMVLDISMPGMTGFEVAGRLSRLPNPPRIVFLTMHDDPDYVDAATAAGGSGYVLKYRMCSDLAPALRGALACRAPVPTRL